MLVFKSDIETNSVAGPFYFDMDPDPTQNKKYNAPKPDLFCYL